MAQPPLLLEESYFDSGPRGGASKYAPDPDGAPRQHGVEMQLGLAKVDASPDLWRVSLDIRHQEVDDEAPRYHFRLRTVGFFKHVADERPEAEVPKLGGREQHNDGLLLRARVPAPPDKSRARGDCSVYRR